MTAPSMAAISSVASERARPAAGPRWRKAGARVSSQLAKVQTAWAAARARDLLPGRTAQAYPALSGTRRGDLSGLKPGRRSASRGHTARLAGAPTTSVATTGSAAWGSAAGLVILLALFGMFYVRLQRADALAARDAMLDPLTGVGNRRRLSRDGAGLQRRGEDTSLVILDLDGFKAYNNRLGHNDGDRLASRSREQAYYGRRGFWRAYRLGGDEFCLLLNGLTADWQVAGIVSRVLEDGLELMYASKHTNRRSTDGPMFARDLADLVASA